MFDKAKFSDGSRLLETETDQLWLVFAGRRHHVTCTEVYKKLFREQVPIEKVNGSVVAGLKRGDDLLFGSCLVRGDFHVAVYFLAVHPKTLKLYPIPNLDTFEKYGFDFSLCRSMPERMIKSISRGHPLH